MLKKKERDEDCRISFFFKSPDGLRICSATPMEFLLHTDIFFSGFKRFNLIPKNLDLKSKISDQYILIKHLKAPLQQ